MSHPTTDPTLEGIGFSLVWTDEEETLQDDLHYHAAQIINTLLMKRRDYGSANINATGLAGVAVRLVDKAHRLHNLTHSGGDANYESISDTINDIIGYGLIARVLEEGDKPW